MAAKLSATIAFDLHVEWVREVRAAAPQPSPSSSLADELALDLAGASHASACSSAHILGGEYHATVGAMSSLAFSDYDADVYDDKPVYRSLGLGGGSFFDGEVFDDEPVYRSLGAGACASVSEFESTTSADESCIPPPMVCRQKGFLSFEF